MPYFTGRRYHILIVAALVTFVLALMYFLRSVFNPFLLALALAYILNPIIRFLEKRRIPRKVAIGGLFVALILGIFLSAILVVPRIYQQSHDLAREVRGEPFQDLNDNGQYDEDPAEPYEDQNGNGLFDPSYFTRGRYKLKAMLAKDGPVRGVLKIFIPEERIEPILEEALNTAKIKIKSITGHADTIAATAWEGSKRGIGWLWDVALLLILTPIYLAFLLNSLDRGWGTVCDYLPGRLRQRAVEILKEIDLVVSAFFRGRLLVCSAMGLFTSIGFALVGVRFGLLFGLLIGLLSFIPFLNVLGLLPTLLSCWMADFGAWDYVWVLGVYSMGQALDPLLTSLILGKDLQLHPVTILLSLFVCSALFGFFGMLLAVPIVASAKILAKEFLLPSMEALAKEDSLALDGGGDS